MNGSRRTATTTRRAAIGTMDRVIGVAAYLLGLVALVVSIFRGWPECVVIVACYLVAYTYMRHMDDGPKDADEVDYNDCWRW